MNTRLRCLCYDVCGHNFERGGVCLAVNGFIHHVRKDLRLMRSRCGDYFTTTPIIKPPWELKMDACVFINAGELLHHNGPTQRSHVGDFSGL